MSKVLVDRELRAAVTAQPAEAEGVEHWSGLRLAAEVAEEDGPWEPRLGMTNVEAAFAQSASPTKVLELIAALTAVTAERDRLRDAAGKAIAWLDAEQNGSGVGINRRLKLCRDAENALRTAMAAKEA